MKSRHLENINEDLLQYLWKLGLITEPELTLTDGSKIKILDKGHHNHDAGPDFLNAKIKTDDGTIWAGNIEIHIKSSDWKVHKHQIDPTYNNVILHVVYHHDLQITDTRGRTIPTLEFNKYVAPKILKKYLHLKQKAHWIPCEKSIDKVDLFTKEMFFDRLMIQRLEAKSIKIDDTWNTVNQDWENLLYITLAKYLGGKVNAQPMEELARATPLSILQKNIDQKEIIEAILFGQAGFLQGSINDNYFNRLKETYRFYSTKYELKPIITPWKFARMRPVSFPTIRIAQLSAFYFYRRNVFSKIIAESNVNNILSLFEVAASSYWEKHYRFGKKSEKNAIKKLGKSTQQSLLINVVSPILFKYGQVYDNQALKEKAVLILQYLKAENNSIIKNWKHLGIIPTNSGQSQALLHLKTEYCDQKACLSCSIGHKLMHLE